MYQNFWLVDTGCCVHNYPIAFKFVENFWVGKLLKLMDNR